MKELFGQSLVNELAESDRLSSAVPGQVAAKNILFSKFWAQLKSIFVVNNWIAREYKSSPCIVVSDKKQYILDESVAPLPFNSTDFATELAANKWIPLGSAGSTAVTSANVALTTPLDSATNQDELNVYLYNNSRWKEDLTAWTTAETTVNLTSQTFRDFGTTPVTVAVTITKTDANAPFLSEFAFKFVFGTGGSFVYPSGVTLAADIITLISGSTYEAYILKGKVIYKKV